MKTSHVNDDGLQNVNSEDTIKYMETRKPNPQADAPQHVTQLQEQKRKKRGTTGIGPTWHQGERPRTSEGHTEESPQAT